ncbi:MAG: hypothetical protein LBO07_06860 [Coriobacteriales bacterium]|jgi:hypothetical protein|nr:hypothetical protein [Coriobacteriales bacterium]
MKSQNSPQQNSPQQNSPRQNSPQQNSPSEAGNAQEADGETYTLSLFEESLDDGTLATDLARFVEGIRSSGLIYHGDPVLCCFVPTVFTPSARTLFEAITATTVSICEKVTRGFIESPGYRSLWGLDELSTGLALLDVGYASLIPMMRADLFFDFDSAAFKFCEINTDGTSAMNEDRCAAAAFRATELFGEVTSKRRLQSQELFEPWVDAALALYAEWAAGKGLSEAPRVAIVDFQEEATTQEFLEFKTRFENRGVDALVVDMADLRYEDGVLFASGLPVNLVYRRAVSPAVIDDAHRRGIVSLGDLDGSACEGSLALISAAKYGAVALIGGFRTLLAHSKQFFEMLWRRETWELLDEEEIEFVRAHVPKTLSFNSGAVDLATLVSSKDQWILKPKSGFGTIGVFAGQEHQESEWRDICERLLDADYVLQEYCEQHQSRNIIPQNGGRSLENMNYLVGLFTYSGKFVGTYIRAGRGAIIGSIRGSGVVPSFWSGEA